MIYVEELDTAYVCLVLFQLLGVFRFRVEKRHDRGAGAGLPVGFL